MLHINVRVHLSSLIQRYIDRPSEDVLQNIARVVHQIHSPVAFLSYAIFHKPFAAPASHTTATATCTNLFRTIANALALPLLVDLLQKPIIHFEKPKDSNLLLWRIIDINSPDLFSIYLERMHYLVDCGSLSPADHEALLTKKNAEGLSPLVVTIKKSQTTLTPLFLTEIYAIILSPVQRKAFFMDLFAGSIMQKHEIERLFMACEDCVTLGQNQKTKTALSDAVQYFNRKLTTEDDRALEEKSADAKSEAKGEDESKKAQLADPKTSKFLHLFPPQPLLPKQNTSTATAHYRGPALSPIPED